MLADSVAGCLFHSAARLRVRCAAAPPATKRKPTSKTWSVALQQVRSGRQLDALLRRDAPRTPAQLSEAHQKVASMFDAHQLSRDQLLGLLPPLTKTTCALVDTLTLPQLAGVLACLAKVHAVPCDEFRVRVRAALERLAGQLGQATGAHGTDNALRALLYASWVFDMLHARGDAWVVVPLPDASLHLVPSSCAEVRCGECCARLAPLHGLMAGSRRAASLTTALCLRPPFYQTA